MFVPPVHRQPQFSDLLQIPQSLYMQQSNNVSPNLVPCPAVGAREMKIVAVPRVPLTALEIDKIFKNDHTLIGGATSRNAFAFILHHLTQGQQAPEGEFTRVLDFYHKYDEVRIVDNDDAVEEYAVQHSVGVDDSTEKARRRGVELFDSTKNFIFTFVHTLPVGSFKLKEQPTSHMCVCYYYLDLHTIFIFVHGSSHHIPDTDPQFNTLLDRFGRMLKARCNRLNIPEAASIVPQVIPIMIRDKRYHLFRAAGLETMTFAIGIVASLLQERVHLHEYIQHQPFHALVWNKMHSWNQNVKSRVELCSRILRRFTSWIREHSVAEYNAIESAIPSDHRVNASPINYPDPDKYITPGAKTLEERFGKQLIQELSPLETEMLPPENIVSSFRKLTIQPQVLATPPKKDTELAFSDRISPIRSSPTTVANQNSVLTDVSIVSTEDGHDDLNDMNEVPSRPVSPFSATSPLSSGCTTPESELKTHFTSMESPIKRVRTAGQVFPIEQVPESENKAPISVPAPSTSAPSIIVVPHNGSPAIQVREEEVGVGGQTSVTTEIVPVPASPAPAASTPSKKPHRKSKQVKMAISMRRARQMEQEYLREIERLEQANKEEYKEADRKAMAQVVEAMALHRVPSPKKAVSIPSPQVTAVVTQSESLPSVQTFESVPSVIPPIVRRWYRRRKGFLSFVDCVSFAFDRYKEQDWKEACDDMEIEQKYDNANQVNEIHQDVIEVADLTADNDDDGDEYFMEDDAIDIPGLPQGIVHPFAPRIIAESSAIRVHACIDESSFLGINSQEDSHDLSDYSSMYDSIKRLFSERTEVSQRPSESTVMRRECDVFFLQDESKNLFLLVTTLNRCVIVDIAVNKSLEVDSHFDFLNAYVTKFSHNRFGRNSTSSIYRIGTCYVDESSAWNKYHYFLLIQLIARIGMDKVEEMLQIPGRIPYTFSQITSQLDPPVVIPSFFTQVKNRLASPPESLLSVVNEFHQSVRLISKDSPSLREDFQKLAKRLRRILLNDAYNTNNPEERFNWIDESFQPSSIMWSKTLYKCAKSKTSTNIKYSELEPISISEQSTFLISRLNLPCTAEELSEETDQQVLLEYISSDQLFVNDLMHFIIDCKWNDWILDTRKWLSKESIGTD